VEYIQKAEVMNQLLALVNDLMKF